MPISDGMDLWPWWLWILSALWIGALVFWQPTATTPRERWGWGALASVYAVLIVFGGRIVPATPAEVHSDSWLLWIGLLAFLGGAVASVGLRRLLWQKIAMAVTTLGAGTMLVVLQAPEAALACGVVGVALARKSAVVPVSDPVGALPRQNVWLTGLAAVVTLVVILGLVRHALIAESSRIGLSRWQTVFPTRTQVARQHAAEETSGAERDSIPMEMWGLVAVCLLAAMTRALSASRRLELSETGLP